MLVTCMGEVFKISQSNYRKFLRNVVEGNQYANLEDFGARSLGGSCQRNRHFARPCGMVVGVNEEGEVMLPINSFTGAHAFLHGDYPIAIPLEGVRYTCVTHAILAYSMKSMADREAIQGFQSLTVVKSYARRKDRREGWSIMKVEAMRILLRKKFRSGAMKAKLIATHGHPLVFGNSGGDRFWGIDGGAGKNLLGRLLMELREEIRSELQANR